MRQRQRQKNEHRNEKRYANQRGVTHAPLAQVVAAQNCQSSLGVHDLSTACRSSGGQGLATSVRRESNSHRPCRFQRASISAPSTNSPRRACSSPSRIAARVSSSRAMIGLAIAFSQQLRHARSIPRQRSGWKLMSDGQNLPRPAFYRRNFLARSDGNRSVCNKGGWLHESWIAATRDGPSPAMWLMTICNDASIQ